MYERFVKDPKIGGALAPFLGEGAIRVWIKDGPAKEYRRALEGKGMMADYTTRAYPGADAVVRAALGAPWKVTSGSVEEKPMRCSARGPDKQTVFVIWGPVASLKELVWHAMLRRVNDPQQAIALVITKPSNAPLASEDWNMSRRMAKVLGADCSQITYAVSKKRSAKTGP